MDSPQLSIPKVDNDISFHQDILLSPHRSHPFRPPGVQALALAHHKRHIFSGLRDDIDKSILYYTEAIFLPLPWDSCCQNIVQLLFSLTDALVHRARQFKRPEDVHCCIAYLRYLRRQPLKVYGVPRSRVLSLLVEALAVHVQMESDGVTVMQDFEEIALLCDEVLVHIQTDSLTYPGTALARNVNARFTRSSRRQLGEPLERVIESLREANRRLPDFHDISITLAWSLLIRFAATCSIDNYEEATAIWDKVIASHAPRDSPTSYQLPPASIVIPSILHSWVSQYGHPEISEEATRLLRIALNVISPDHPFRPFVTTALERFQERRFNDFGVTEGLEDVHSRNSDVCGLPIGGPSLAKLNDGKPPPMTTGQHIDIVLSDLGITNIADVEEAIKYFRKLLAVSHPSGLFSLVSAGGLIISLLSAFERTDKIEYLNETIASLRDVLNMSSRSYSVDIQFIAVRQLISCLSTRLRLLNHTEDLDEIMQLFPTAANNGRARVPERFQLSCDWASLARYSKHSTTLTAHENAISLMQDSLAFAPTLEVQHFRLVAMRDNYEKLPLDYASYQVHTGRLEQAIETLERGRALLWSEMRGLRTSIDRLRAADSRLAQKFAAINQKLEMLTLSVLPGGGQEMDDGEADGREGMDPFGYLVLQQRTLLEEREKLISQIQALPGFESFLKAPSFDTLRSAASHGPVIIISHNRWRSDILILLHDSPPSLITTKDDFYKHAIELKDRLVLTQKKYRLESRQYQRALRFILENLYELVGRPVIQELRKLNIPEQSRIWWYPTSAFCSLPLHAMGPIPSDDGVRRYFSDLYISSYTPTLSTLIESRKRSGLVFEKPPILLVAQPDEALLRVFEEIWVIQRLDTKVTTLLSKRATPSSVVDGLQDHRFSHFACHGILEPGKPFNASFKLHGGERLTLLDIVRSRLPAADFAFLSACHTAEMTDGSIADEALHLTAAMQYCGFRSVVGTMWAMADTDGRDLAKHFYKSMFSSDEPGVPYYERSARALRDAVQNLRRSKVLPLERWVNFVHYGA
ncbi:CHAT domain-containing protein [Lactifluus subvellereus]|nr:CHAT domain-containing protein [Lactifluus subvellereus]